MRASEYPITTLDTDASEAARFLAAHRLPGLLVTDDHGCPHTVLDASQAVQFLVPAYVRACPALAGVIDEKFADQAAGKLSGHAVRDLLPKNRSELAVVESDDTIIEIAAGMARTHCPLVAVVESHLRAACGRGRRRETIKVTKEAVAIRPRLQKHHRLLQTVTSITRTHPAATRPQEHNLQHVAGYPHQRPLHIRGTRATLIQRP